MDMYVCIYIHIYHWRLRNSKVNVSKMAMVDPDMAM